MKLNREQLAAVLAVLILSIGAREILLGAFAPTGKVLPVDPEISRTRREVVPRMYRRFRADREPTRNPFVFSEGWQPLAVVPMTVPPLPPASRPVPRPLLGAPESEARVRFVESGVREASSKDGATRGAAGAAAKEGG